MQQKRNQIIANSALTLLSLISSILLAQRNTLSTMEDINVFQFSSKTLLILSITGVIANFLLSMIVNINVYKVIFKISHIKIETSNLYFLITLSLFVSNVTLLLIPQVNEVTALSLLLQNMLSYLIFIGISIAISVNNHEPRKHILILSAYLIVFSLSINSISVFVALNGGLEALS